MLIDFNIVDRDVSAIRSIESTEEVKQGALAAS
jgi:hypothetical protein